MLPGVSDAGERTVSTQQGHSCCAPAREPRSACVTERDAPSANPTPLVGDLRALAGDDFLMVSSDREGYPADGE